MQWKCRRFSAVVALAAAVLSGHVAHAQFAATSSAEGYAVSISDNNTAWTPRVNLRDPVRKQVDTGEVYNGVANTGYNVTALQENGTTIAKDILGNVRGQFEWNGGANSSFSAYSGFGHLHARATGYAWIDQRSQTVIYDSGTGFRGITHFNPYFMQGSATARAAFSDVVTITSGSLPVGTEVTIRLIVELDASISKTAAGGYTSAEATFSTGLDELTVTATDEGSVWRGELETVVKVGEILSLRGDLDISATAQAYVQYDPVNPIGIMLASAMVDAGNTAHFYLQSVTGGVDFVSASGASYAIPEPGVAGTLLGLGGMLIVRRRR